MRRIIMIGLLLVAVAVIITWGIGLAQRPADQAPSAVRSGSAVARDAPSTKAMFSSAPASKTTGSLPRGATVTVPPPVSASAETVPWAMGGGGMSGASGPGMMLGPGMPGSSGMGGMMPGSSGMPGMVGPPGMMSGPGGGYAADAETQALLLRLQQAQAEERVLIAQYAAATNDQERTQLKELLSKSIDGQFDLQQQIRQRELQPIEARVKRLRELIEKRNQARKTIVERRLDQVLREAEGLGWTTPPEAAAVSTPQISGAYFPGGTSRAGSTASFTSRSAASTSSGSGTGRSSAAAVSPKSELSPNPGPAAFAASTSDPSPANVAVTVVEGSVLTDPASGRIEISLGTDKGLHKGVSLMVYRGLPDGQRLTLGLVEVVEAKPDRAVCKTLLDLQKGPIQKGDRVATAPLPDHFSKQTEVKVFKVVNGDVSAYAATASALPGVREKRVRIAVDKGTNSLVVAGPKDDLFIVESLVLSLNAGAQRAPKP